MTLILCKVFQFYLDDLSCLVYAFILFNALASFLPKEIQFSLPFWIYRITGAIRYVLLPYLANDSSVVIHFYYKSMSLFIMICELAAILCGAFLYAYKNSPDESEVKNNTLTAMECFGKKNGWGIASILVLVAGVFLLSLNQNYLSRFFSLAMDIEANYDIAGYVVLILSAFFLLLYINVLQFISKLLFVNTFAKVLFSFLITLFYLKGTSVTGDNVSRWTFLFSLIIAFNFITFFYPNIKNKLLIVCIIFLCISLPFGTMVKFQEGHKGYETMESTVSTQFTYEIINSYFNGPQNVDIGLQMIDELDNHGVSRHELFFSDFFSNFPLLNSFLSNTSLNSTMLFNRSYYRSNIATDKIVPCSVQLYSYFNILYVFCFILFSYFSLYLFNRVSLYKNFLLRYCLIYTSISFALIHCISFSIILQNIWIHVLPIFIIHLLDKKIALGKIQ